MITLLLTLHTAALADTPLDSLTPELRAQFEAAESAWQEEDLSAAEAAFQAVTTGAPEFDRAWRRQCGVVLSIGRVDAAVEMCRKAVSLNPSLENRTGLAIALLQVDEAAKEARTLLEAAVAESPTYTPAWQGLCAWALAAQAAEPISRCAPALEAAAPRTPGSLFYKALLLADQGEIGTASETLLYAEQQGLPEEMTARGNEWIRARTATADPAARVRNGKHADSPWTLTDLIPFGVIGALVLAVGVLAFGKDEEEPQEPPPPSGA